MRSLLLVLSIVNGRYHSRYEWMSIDSASKSESAAPTEMKLEQGPGDIIQPATKATTKATTSTTTTTEASTTKAATTTTTKATTLVTKKKSPPPEKAVEPDYNSPKEAAKQKESEERPTKKKLDQDEDDFMVSKNVNRVILTPEYHIHHTLLGTIVLGWFLTLSKLEI